MSAPANSTPSPSSSAESNFHTPQSQPSPPQNTLPNSPLSSTDPTPPLLSLPLELLHHLLSYLPPPTLATISLTCRTLHTHSTSPHLWRSFFHSPHHPYPSSSSSSPFPFSTYKSLYSAHYPFWHLPQHAIWFTDKASHSNPFTGLLALALYDHRTGNIEAYRLTATLPDLPSGTNPFHRWERDPRVRIRDFNPTVSLFRDDPVLKLRPRLRPVNSSPSTSTSSNPTSNSNSAASGSGSKVPRETGLEGGGSGNRLQTETPLSSASVSTNEQIRIAIGGEGQPLRWLARSVHATIFPAISIPLHAQAKNMEVWPPWSIPAVERVRCGGSVSNFAEVGHRPGFFPGTRAVGVGKGLGREGKESEAGKGEGREGKEGKGGEMSMTTFRLRKWVYIGGGNMGEDVSTWATLGRELWERSEKKPYRGIWVGDFGGHGCEFLVVLQRGRKECREQGVKKVKGVRGLRDTGRWRAWVMGVVGDLGGEEEEEEEEGEGGVGGDGVERGEGMNAEEEDGEMGEVGEMGRLDAIKLTGDPNVPRGEPSWICEDIGAARQLRVANEEPFRGARVVKSWGHVAAEGFRSDNYIPAQLFLISHDLLAQYWEAMDHISYFRRVNIDELLKLE